MWSAGQNWGRDILCKMAAAGKGARAGGRCTSMAWRVAGWPSKAPMVEPPPLKESPAQSPMFGVDKPGLLGLSRGLMPIAGRTLRGLIKDWPAWCYTPRAGRQSGKEGPLVDTPPLWGVAGLESPLKGRRQGG